MFANTKVKTLDLSSFDTSNVTEMYAMYWKSKIQSIDLTNFNTHNVTNMGCMFQDSEATEINISTFDTSSIKSLLRMFYKAKVTTIDLSSFDVTDPDIDLSDMFRSSKITTGYAKNQANCNRFNASSNKPASLTFVVKE